MLKFNAKEGITFVHDESHREYQLCEEKTFCGITSQDTITIWDHSTCPSTIVNFVYGAESLKSDLVLLDKTIRYYVDQYESSIRYYVNQYESSISFQASVETVKDFMNHLSEVSDGEDEEWDRFTEAEWTISFMGKSATLCNGADVFDSMWKLLKEYLDEAN